MFGHGDDQRALLGSATVDESAIRELAAREQLWECLVLHVVDRRDGRNSFDFRHHRAEREMQNIEVVQAHLAPNASTEGER